MHGVGDEAQVQEVGAMSKRKDEAAYLESQADRLEEFIDFDNPRPAVIPEAEALDLAVDPTDPELAAR
jgi:hypothetical protein